MHSLPVYTTLINTQVAASVTFSFSIQYISVLPHTKVSFRRVRFISTFCSVLVHSHAFIISLYYTHQYTSGSFGNFFYFPFSISPYFLILQFLLEGYEILNVLQCVCAALATSPLVICVTCSTFAVSLPFLRICWSLLDLRFVNSLFHPLSLCETRFIFTTLKHLLNLLQHLPSPLKEEKFISFF